MTQTFAKIVARSLEVTGGRTALGLQQGTSKVLHPLAAVGSDHVFDFRQ